MEDRSKYEKLTGSLDDLSSNGSSDNESTNYKLERPTTTITTSASNKRRNIKNIPEKIHSVCSKVDIPLVKTLMPGDHRSTNSKAVITASSHKQQVGYESDDSIGSASDLRANEDAPETEERDNGKADEISETISESIRTCGSSAYHAECESMATREDDCMSRIVRLKKSLPPSIPQQEEDMLFVGHQYGEKPLLLDDELDSDCELKLDNSTWSIEKKINPKDIWIEPKSFEDSDDVFAQAPFHKSSMVQRRKKSHPTAMRVSPLKEESGRNTSENIFEETPQASRNQSPLLILSPPTQPDMENEQLLLDTEVTNNINTIDTTSVHHFPTLNNLNPFAETATAFPAGTPIQSISTYGIVTVNSNIINIELPNSSTSQDLFKTNEFDAFVFDHTPTEPLNFPTPTETNYFAFDTPYCDTNLDNKQAIYENVTLPDVFSNHNTDFAFIRKSQEFLPRDNEVRTDSGNLDVYKMASLGSSVSLNLNNVDLKTTVKDKDELPSPFDDTMNLFQVAGDTESASYYKQHRYHEDKKDKKGKSKYQLMETDTSDAQMDEMPLKSSLKIGKSNIGYKKASSKNKKTNSKLPKAQVGFSNMSFEDFPSDDAEHVGNMPTPFEVVRKSYEEEKKYGSLKRRSNPFS